MIARENGERLVFLTAAEQALIRKGMGAFPAAEVWGFMAKFTAQAAFDPVATIEQTAEVERVLGPVEQISRWESYETHTEWQRRT